MSVSSLPYVAAGSRVRRPVVMGASLAHLFRLERDPHASWLSAAVFESLPPLCQAEDMGSGIVSFPERDRGHGVAPLLLMRKQYGIVKGFARARTADRGPLLRDVSGNSSVSVPSATGLRPKGPVTLAFCSHSPLPGRCQIPRDLETLALSWRRVLGCGEAVATIG